MSTEGHACRYAYLRSAMTLRRRSVIWFSIVCAQAADMRRAFFAVLALLLMVARARSARLMILRARVGLFVSCALPTRASAVVSLDSMRRSSCGSMRSDWHNGLMSASLKAQSAPAKPWAHGWTQAPPAH